MVDNSSTPFLVVGLGNPGAQYHKTHHNLGFEVVDLLAKTSGMTEKFREKFQSHYAELKISSRKVLAIKPMTFMNLSGQAVGEFVRFYKCDPATDLVVIIDDLDLPQGKLRLRMSGGSGGHNGMKSIISHLGTEGFPRLRVGIGRDTEGATRDHVLSKIGAKAWQAYEESLGKAVESIQKIISEGLPKAMNFCNRVEGEPEGEEGKEK